jgi:gliding motility-associated lipoprotein GldD
MKKRIFSIFSLVLLIFTGIQSCKEEVLPKPRAQLRLEYETPKYSAIQTECPFQFDRSEATRAVINQKCWVNLEYPELKASINMTYRPVEDNLEELLREAEKLTFNHTIKADGISSRPYVNSDHKVYGSIFEVTGNAASPVQFHVTDSMNHFITGAVYFEVQPNYDSIRPAIQYIEKDIVALIESLEWKN